MSTQVIRAQLRMRTSTGGSKRCRGRFVKESIRAAERRTVRSKQTTVVRPCPYYLRSRVRHPDGFPEERRNSGIASIPQNNIRKRSLSMEALDQDPVDRSE
ncbi:uncharacterized protein TNCV_2179191 [Trichonephila clavipes]|uniref:Uncharacterized protein n=1 Tax=Trichonephila clavipes TaxID=2585209 RepID=A0A8X6VUC7_TRICX|nr:uncharacterized protein TNCV_2179191 [Trichonephila clavipes]